MKTSRIIIGAALAALFVSCTNGTFRAARYDCTDHDEVLIDKYCHIEAAKIGDTEEEQTRVCKAAGGEVFESKSGVKYCVTDAKIIR